MNRSCKYISLGCIVVLLSIFIAGCTTSRDGFAYRVFHNTTARYNGYFYANESMKEAQMVLNEAQVEDYDEVLPIFIYGTEESAQEIFPQAERAIEKSSRVIERHNMKPSSRDAKKTKRPEMNKWIDDNYLLVGIAHFYKRDYFKSEELFQYVTRKYKEKEMQAQGSTWLARTYIEREKWTKANNLLIKTSQITELEDETRADIHQVYADYFVRQGEWEDAIEQLEYALRYISKKKDRARPTFILAQLKQKLNKSSDAIALYKEVLKLRPEYEMEFYARINQAMAYDRRGGNSAPIKEQLFKMLKDDKNIEYQDQIYYALAEIELEERNRDQGIDYLVTSLDKNVDNKKQKIKSFLRLADLHLEDRVYPMAQAYYDSTFQNIDEEHVRYTEIKNLAESLTDLVVNLDIIADQDSLQSFCEDDFDKRERRVAKLRRQMVEDLQAEIDEQERLANEMAALANAANSGAASFWPYNPALKVSGFESFKNDWGDRPLEDNWRRSNKLNNGFSNSEETEGEETTVITEAASADDMVPSIDELMANLPCDDEFEMAASNSKLAEAYYNAGVVYKEKLDDRDNALEQWEVLINRMDESDYHATTYYQLYRTYLFMEEEEGYKNPMCTECSSKYWGGIILDKYPGSEWAKLVENPEYEDYAELIRGQEEEAYQQLYLEHARRQYQQVVIAADSVIRSQPDNHLLCKYRLLKAQSQGYMDAVYGITANVEEALKSVVDNCPDTEEAAYAKTLLSKLNGEEEVEPEKEEEEEEEVVAPENEIYEFNESARHYFCLVFPTDGEELQTMKGKVSDFNKASFSSSSLKVSSNLIDRQNQVILVKTFNKLDDAKAYYTAFTNNKQELKAINEKEFMTVLISKDNYVQLFKTKKIAEYEDFFARKYGL